MRKFLFNFYRIFKYTRAAGVKIYYSGNPKAKIRTFFELMSWYIKEGTVNANYYAYGLNIKNRLTKSYIGKKEFIMIKDKAEDLLKINYGAKGFNFDIVTKDKLFASSILAVNGIHCVENIAIINNGKLISNTSFSDSSSSLFEMDLPIFIKNTILEYNEGLIKLEKRGQNYYANNALVSMEQLNERLSKGFWIVQKQVESSEAIRKFNDTALNTTRVYTIIRKMKPEFLGGFQSFATQREFTDSWGKGSVYVGFDPVKETLDEFGFFHPTVTKYSRVDTHPDSDIKFKDYIIPGLREAVEICKKGHLLFYGNYILGWDIAITDNGPTVVEVNEKPGINAVQVICGGMRHELLKDFSEFKNHYN